MGRNNLPDVIWQCVLISLRNSCPLTLYLSSAQTCVKMFISKDLHCSIRYRIQKNWIITHSPTVQDSLPIQKTVRPPQPWAHAFNQFHMEGIIMFVAVASVLNTNRPCFFKLFITH